MSDDVTEQIKMARNIRDIRTLYRQLEGEALYHFAAKGMPGGDAIDHLGPIGNREAWENMIDAAEARALDPDIRGPYPEHVADQSDPNELPVLAVVAGWEDIIRDYRGEPTDLKATVDRSCDYLVRVLDWLHGVNEYGDVNFLAIDELADELRQCRVRLENLLTAGIRHDTGAPCLECGRVLVKVWKEAEESDAWRCSRCHDDVSPERYKIAVRAGYLAHADKLNATDMLEAYRIMPGTLTAWATRGYVRKRGKDDSGRQLYDVKDALTKRDGEVA